MLGLQSIPFYAHAFEPSHQTYRILHDNSGNRANFLLNNFGLEKHSGKFKLFYDDVGSGLAFLIT